MDTAQGYTYQESSEVDLRLTYCYICNVQIQTERPKDWDATALALDARGKSRDYAPVTCGFSECLEQYHRVLSARIPQLSAPHLDEVVYDGGPFLEFAKRNHRNEILEQVDPLTESQVAPQYLFEHADQLEPLFQAWFFFGLLQEFLGPSFRKEDFLDDSKQLITTRQLQGILKVWTCEEIASKDVHLQTAAHYKTCLEFTYQIVRLANREVRSHTSSFDRDLFNVLVVTIDMLETAVLAKFSSESHRRSGIGTCVDPTLLNRAIENGWCPYEANNVIESSFTLAHILFNFEVQKWQSKPLHITCTSNECAQLLADPDGITETLHRPGGCTCEMIGPDELQMRRIYEILLKDQIPVLRLQRKSEEVVTLEVVEATKESSYIAISHVWRQGLGNSLANRIPHCQLRRLWEDIESLTSITTLKGTDQSMCLWLDTLCCPVTPEKARNAAIVLMRKTFMDAAHVLVLDSELENFSAENMPVLELASRLSFIQWTRRLWTLQESSLAQQLWFRLKDRMINAHSLWLALRDIWRQPDAVCATLATLFLTAYHSMRNFGGNYVNSVGPALKYQTLSSGLAFRSVTKPCDEPLCLATLLGLDIQQILQVPEQERMKVLWKLISNEQVLTKQILFYSGSKLRESGYRWAPSTLLQATIKKGLTWPTDGLGAAVMGPDGLQLKSPGISLHVPGSHHGLDADRWELHGQTGLSPFSPFCKTSSILDVPSMLSLRDLDGQWLFMISFDSISRALTHNDYAQDPDGIWRLLGFSTCDYALLQVKPGPLIEAYRDRRALLVRIEAANDTISCVPVGMVGMSPHNATWTRVMERATEMAEEIRKGVDQYTPRDKVHNILSDGIESSLGQIEEELDEAGRMSAASTSWSAEDLKAYISSCSSFQADLAAIGCREGFRQVLRYAVAGRYAVVKEYLAENQSWVIG